MTIPRGKRIFSSSPGPASVPAPTTTTTTTFSFHSSTAGRRSTSGQLSGSDCSPAHQETSNGQYKELAPTLYTIQQVVTNRSAYAQIASSTWNTVSQHFFKGKGPGPSALRAKALCLPTPDVDTEERRSESATMSPHSDNGALTEQSATSGWRTRHQVHNHTFEKP